MWEHDKKMLALFLITLAARIVPLTLPVARTIVEAWAVTAPIDHPRRSALQISAAKLRVRPSKSLVAVGMEDDDGLRAVAIFEKRHDDTLHLWCVETNDDASATHLLSTLLKSEYNFTHTLDPRWQIAIGYLQ